MAAIGQGDARWIVTDLGEEGQNVGQYHWEEKDVMKWVKSTLKERFAELQLFDPSTTENFLDIKTTGLHSAKGEATVCNRKKKLFALYELDITLTFSAKVKQPNNSDKPEKVVEGKIFFPYISNENSAEDFSYRVQMDKSEDEEYRLDIHKKAEAKLRDVMTKFVQDLKSGANYALKRQSKESSGNIEPKDGATSPTPAPAIAASAKPKEASSSTSSAQPASSEFLSLNVTQKFNCRPEDLFDCFVNAQKISAYTQSKCTFANPETLKGSKFSMLNGNIEGVFEEIIPNERLEQKWRMQDWEDGVFSKLVLSFSFQNGETSLKLQQTHIPSNDKYCNSVLEKIKQGWSNIFFNPIRIVFGFGGKIMI